MLLGEAHRYGEPARFEAAGRQSPFIFHPQAPQTHSAAYRGTSKRGVVPSPRETTLRGSVTGKRLWKLHNPPPPNPLGRVFVSPQPGRIWRTKACHSGRGFAVPKPRGGGHTRCTHNASKTNRRPSRPTPPLDISCPAYDGGRKKRHPRPSRIGLRPIGTAIGYD